MAARTPDISTPAPVPHRAEFCQGGIEGVWETRPAADWEASTGRLSRVSPGRPLFSLLPAPAFSATASGFHIEKPLIWAERRTDLIDARPGACRASTVGAGARMSCGGTRFRCARPSRAGCMSHEAEPAGDSAQWCTDLFSPFWTACGAHGVVRQCLRVFGRWTDRPSPPNIPGGNRWSIAE